MEPAHKWPRGVIESYYTEGQCHYLAIALNRLTGLNLGIMWDQTTWHIEPDDDDDGVREVVHVFVQHPEGGVVDIMGHRSIDAVRKQLAPSNLPKECLCEPLGSELLNTLMQETESLWPVTEADIDEATEVIMSDPVLSALVEEYRLQTENAAPSM